MQLTCSGGSGGHDTVEGEALGLADTFIVGEDESSVLLNGGARGGPELNAMERGNIHRVEEVAGIEDLVSVEDVDAPMELVGTRPRDRIDNSTRRAAILRGVGGGDHIELLDRVDAKVRANHVAGSAVCKIILVDAVHSVGVLIGRMAVGYQLIAKTTHATIRTSHGGRLLRADIGHTWLQGCKLSPVSAIQREFLDALLSDGCTDDRRIRLNVSSTGVHLNFFVGGSYRERYVQLPGRSHSELQAPLDIGRKPRSGDGDRVDARLEVCGTVHSRAVGSHRAHGAGRVIPHDQACRGHDGIGRI